MKLLKKILLIICVIIIAVGMFILGRQGLNYSNGYTQNILLETVKSYVGYVAVATAVVFIYLVIRYSKQGILKVTVTLVLSLVGALALTLAVMALVKMPITRLFFPIMLFAYVSSIMVVSSYFEENT